MISASGSGVTALQLPPTDARGRVEDVAAELTHGLAKLAAGHPVVFLDEVNNCGYLAQAAEHASVDFIALATTHGTGVVRVVASEERLDALRIPTFGAGAHRAPVDLADGVARGIRAHRAATLRAFAAEKTAAGDFVAPGHVFPSAAGECLTLDTSCPMRAALEAMVLAGLEPVAGYAELVDHWGRPADLRACIWLARRLDLTCISVRAVIVERERLSAAVDRCVEASIPTPDASFTAIAYRGRRSGLDYVAFVADLSDQVARVHVQRRCLLGDVFGSRACLCGEGLRAALGEVRLTGRGVIIYHAGDETGPPRDHLNEAPAGWAVTAELASILQDLGALRISLTANELIDSRDLTDLGIDLVEGYVSPKAPATPRLGIARAGRNARDSATAPSTNANV